MTPRDDLLVIRISGTTGHKVSTMATLFDALDKVHRELTLLDGLVSLLEKNPDLANTLLRVVVEEGLKVVPGPSLAHGPSDEDKVSDLMRPLVFHSASFSSPGLWEFLGKLNPLEVLREFINDRHRHRQDREYREAAEKRRLELENFLLENKIIVERVQILREAGLSEEELRLLRRRLVPALVELDSAVNEGVIGSSEVLSVRVIESPRQGVITVPSDEATAVESGDGGEGETRKTSERQVSAAG